MTWFSPSSLSRPESEGSHKYERKHSIFCLWRSKVRIALKLFPDDLLQLMCFTRTYKEWKLLWSMLEHSTELVRGDHTFWQEVKICLSDCLSNTLFTSKYSHWEVSFSVNRVLSSQPSAGHGHFPGNLVKARFKMVNHGSLGWGCMVLLLCSPM